MIYLWVALGSVIGGTARFWGSGYANVVLGETFPWGTLIINILGSFVIGFFFTLTGPDGRFVVNSDFRQFFMVGVCGGFTTFSSFSLQTLNLARDGEFFLAGVNVVASVILCLIAVFLGHIAAAFVNQLKGA